MLLDSSSKRFGVQCVKYTIYTHKVTIRIEKIFEVLVSGPHANMFRMLQNTKGSSPIFPVL